MNYKNYMSYSIQKIFGSYSINIEKGNCTQSFYDVQEDIIDIIKYLERENQEFKKENEEYKRLGFKHLNDKCNKLENQQKEFVEYLTSYIKLLNNKPDLIEESQIDILKEILQKYKEIIGVKDEKI